MIPGSLVGAIGFEPSRASASQKKRQRAYKKRFEAAFALSQNPAQFGRGDRIRTYDIQLPKLALYQAELHPDA